MAVITIRFAAAYNGIRLGKDSPFNQTVVVFVSNFQASAAIATLTAGAFALGVLLRSEILLPFGVGLVSIANALLVGLPQHTTAPAGFRSQIAYSLSRPDGLLFRLPAASLPPACLIPFAAGVLACGAVSLLVRT